MTMKRVNGRVGLRRLRNDRREVIASRVSGVAIQKIADGLPRRAARSSQ